jgi:uncharacterized protein YqjF (DUF2071 family)
MRQVWRDLLFMHWSVDSAWLRSQLPEGLEVDLYENQAWIGIVPFDMQGVTARGCPAPSTLCDFPELNVRTYVVRNGVPGVWFFSLDVNKALPVWAANTFFHLPYFKAEMAVMRDEKVVHYRHQRKDLIFQAAYRPLDPPETFSEESFEAWSTTRYCLYAQSKKGKLYRGHIHHAPWPLQRAEIDLQQNTLLDTMPTGERHPSILFSKELHVVVYPLESLT